MAGRPRKRALIAELNQRIDQTFELEDGDDRPSHLDYVCERVECGTTTKALAAELSISLGFELTYAQLMAHLREQHGETETEQRVDSARVRASHLYAEEGLELVDGADKDSSSAVSKAAVQAKQRNWMAERYNPARFGQQKQLNASISVTHLHLTALQAVPNGVTSALPSGVNNSTLDPSKQVQAIAPQALGSE